MAQSQSSAASNSSECSVLKRNSSDVGWEYAVLVNPNNKDRTKCLLCLKEYSGGIHRLKEHVAHIRGNVAPCSKSTKEDQEKCKKALEDTKGKKREKREAAMNLREEVHILDEEDEDDHDEMEVLGSKKKPHHVGPMDKYATAINPNLSASKQMRQQNLNDAISKKKSHEVSQYLARWIHTNKRNRLDATRLNNLVYVQFNAKLINNKKRRKEKKRDVLLSNEATHAQGWIVERGDDGIDPISGLSYELIGEAMGADEYLEPRRSGRNVGVRELHEDDFVSEDDADDDEEVDEDFECEDDEGLVMEGYGEEEEMEE